MRPPCPCKGCEDRTPTCHAQCPDGKYDKWKAVLAEEMKAKMDEIMKNFKSDRRGMNEEYYK